MSLVETIEKILLTEGESIVRDLRANMISSGANASGKTSASLLTETATTDTKAQLQISGGIGWAFVEQGRGRTRKKDGTGEVKKAIRKWIDFKGIQPEDGITKDTLAFLISRAIHTRGTLLHLLNERRDVYSSVINEDRLSRILDNVSEDITIEIQSDFLNRIKVK